MTTPRFADSRTKTAQASRHIVEVKRLLQEHADTIKVIPGVIPTEILSRYPNATIVPFGQISFNPLPEAIPATIGDAVHNLRSALDILVVEAARLITGDGNKVAFPFANEISAFNRAKKERFLSKCGNFISQLVDELRPYPQGNLILYSIHDMDISDKHRNLLPVSQFIARPVFDTWTGELVGDITKPSAVRYVWPDTNPLQGQEVETTLEQMSNEVLRIIDQFESHLEEAILLQNQIMANG